jgi:hypothetical protein
LTCFFRDATLGGMEISDRYSELEDGRILDCKPMKEGDFPLVSARDGKWKTFEGTLGDIFDSVPFTEEEIEDLRKQGILPR